MRLAVFIEQEKETIIVHAVEFARTLTVFSEADEVALRDHFPEVLQDIADDMRTEQTEVASIAKSQGDGAIDPQSDAVFHGRQRALAGLRIDQVIAEYRALRSSVLRLWHADAPDGNSFPLDIGRFNEAIDQAIAESVGAFATEVESRRQIYFAAVGHDLRGPLQAITMSAGAIANKSPPQLTRYADMLTVSVARMGNLLDSLLDYNLIGLGGALRLNPTHVDLHVECEDEILILQAALPKATIEWVSQGDCRGTFDGSRVREALSNLVTNAAKYGLSAQPVRVRLAGCPEAVEICVTNVVQHEIPASDLACLFDPLRRGSGAQHSEGRASLGLGLFITKEIADAHSGAATVACEADSITFTLKLPKIAR